MKEEGESETKLKPSPQDIKRLWRRRAFFIFSVGHWTIQERNSINTYNRSNTILQLLTMNIHSGTVKFRVIILHQERNTALNSNPRRSVGLLLWNPQILCTCVTKESLKMVYTQNKRRHKIIQQKRKKHILLKDLSACITCLLTLGLLLPARRYEFGYEYKFAIEFPNTLVYTISPSIPIIGSTVFVDAPPRLIIGEAG